MRITPLVRLRARRRQYSVMLATGTLAGLAATLIIGGTSSASQRHAMRADELLSNRSRRQAPAVSRLAFGGSSALYCASGFGTKNAGRLDPSSHQVTLLTKDVLETTAGCAGIRSHRYLAATIGLEIQPAKGPWVSLGPSARINAYDRDIRARTLDYEFVPKVAGVFRIRSVITAGGKKFASPDEPLEVRFPTGRQISRNPSVQRFTRATWNAVLAATAGTHQRREKGFFIWLNTCKGKYKTAYGHTPVRTGSPPPPGKAASLVLGTPPSDSPADPAPTGCGTYTVASFHAHTPTTFRSPRGDSRRTGPSDGDDIANGHYQLPGLVYDYLPFPRTGDSIPFGYRLSGPAALYLNGLSRRPTPLK